MKTFDEIELDHDRALKELHSFMNRLTSKRSLREREDILPAFRQRPHLSALCGLFGPSVFNPSRIAWEYDLFGDCGCDLVVGDWQTKSYAFIEFESAAPNSVFVKHGRKAAREWSPRFLHGFAQLVDWFQALDDRRRGDDFEAHFGKRSIDLSGLLVVGRDEHLSRGERFRLEWWRQKVAVDSRRIVCITYDELVAHLLRSLRSSARQVR